MRNEEQRNELFVRSGSSSLVGRQRLRGRGVSGQAGFDSNKEYHHTLVYPVEEAHSAVVQFHSGAEIGVKMLLRGFRRSASVNIATVQLQCYCDEGSAWGTVRTCSGLA
jgi:hypothetical protein